MSKQSHANLSQPRASNVALTTTAISGLNLRELWASCDPAFVSLRTCLESSTWRAGLTGYALTWKRQATKSGRLLYRLRLSAPRTAATASGSSRMMHAATSRANQLSPSMMYRDAGSWAHMMPTPTANEPGIAAERIVDKGGNPPSHPNQRLHDKHTGRVVQDGLVQYVAMWPTPNAAKAGNDVGLTASGDGREKPNKLGWAVAQRLWMTPKAGDADFHTPSTSDRPRAMSTHLGTQVMFATPRTSDARGAGHHGDGGVDLRTQVKMLPTATAHDAKDTGAPSEVRRKSPVRATSAGAANALTGLKLSAAWVSALMQYPEGWMEDLPADPLSSTTGGRATRSHTSSRTAAPAGNAASPA